MDEKRAFDNITFGLLERITSMDSTTGGTGRLQSTYVLGAELVRPRPLSVLFLSTGGAVRSPIAASALQVLSRGEVTIFAAGVEPKQFVDPMAQIAVRNIFNGRPANSTPQSLAAVAERRIDVVFTLSEEAAKADCLFAHHRTHWLLDDPCLVHGSRAHRQHAFDRLTRTILKGLRVWWSQLNATAHPTAEVTPATPHRRGGPQAHWRTKPSGDAPILMVVSEQKRSCMNLCGLLERTGFTVLCNGGDGRSGGVSVVPDAVLVRASGDGRGTSRIRTEFQTARALRESFGTVPVLVFVDRALSGRERDYLRESNIDVFRRRDWLNSGFLVKTLDELIERSRQLSQHLSSPSPLRDDDPTSS